MDFSLILIGVTFLTGIVTTLLPCTFPIILGFLGFISSTERDHLDKSIMMKRTFLFFIGLAIVFVFFGGVAGIFGHFTDTTLLLTGPVKSYLTKIGGVLLLLFGLFLLRAIPLPRFLNHVKSMKIPKWISVESKSGPIILGAIFATGWSPCIGPVLASIFVIAGSSDTVLFGMFLFAIFALGMSVPLFIIAYFYSQINKIPQKYAILITQISSILGGSILIILGIIFITGQASLLTVLARVVHFTS